MTATSNVNPNHSVQGSEVSIDTKATVAKSACRLSLGEIQNDTVRACQRRNDLVSSERHSQTHDTAVKEAAQAWRHGLPHRDCRNSVAC